MSSRPDESQYIHGTAGEEQRRLRLMNTILNEGSMRELKPQKGDRVIEFGAGLGEFARMIAAVTGELVVGIERSAAQLLLARNLAQECGEGPLLDLREGDVLAPPLSAEERGSFDIAHARFLLEHVRDPLGAVQQMVESVKRGGRIVLEDDDHDLLRLWPEPPAVMNLWRAYIRSYDRIGNDPFIGRRLVELLHRAGAKPVRSSQIFFGACSGGETLEALVENLYRILEGALPTIVDLDLLDRASGNEALVELRQWGSRDDAAFWYSMAWAEGVRRERELSP